MDNIQAPSVPVSGTILRVASSSVSLPAVFTLFGRVSLDAFVYADDGCAIEALHDLARLAKRSRIISLGSCRGMIAV
jgi:hypothetical protein